MIGLLLAAAAPAQPPSQPDCAGHADSSAIVVCGSRPGESRYRLPKLPERYEPKQIRAETDIIPGVHTRAHVDSQTMPDGSRSNRAMITFSTPF